MFWWTATAVRPAANNVEVALDIDMAIVMATNLSAVIVYQAQNNGITPVDVLNRIVSDNLAKQISSSWLIGNNSSYDTAYKQMAAQGQTFFQASGDDGAFYPGIGQSNGRHERHAGGRDDFIHGRTGRRADLGIGVELAHHPIRLTPTPPAAGSA